MTLILTGFSSELKRLQFPSGGGAQLFYDRKQGTRTVFLILPDISMLFQRRISSLINSLNQAT